MASGCDAGFWSQLFSGNAIVCSDTFKQYEAGQSTKQIIDATEYAKSNYPGNAVVAAIQDDAASTAAQFSQDSVNVIASQLADNPSCEGLDFSWLGGPCITKTWLYVAGGLAAAIFFFVYVAPLLSLFKRR
jgi:hypothetical protein